MIYNSWFDSLTMVGLQKHHSWLNNLPSQIKRIANFGCWSGGEPFALVWTLDAEEVMVIEKEENYIKEFQEQIEIVNLRYPESLDGRIISHLCRDMTQPI